MYFDNVNHHTYIHIYYFTFLSSWIPGHNDLFSSFSRNLVIFVKGLSFPGLQPRRPGNMKNCFVLWWHFFNYFLCCCRTRRRRPPYRPPKRSRARPTPRAGPTPCSGSSSSIWCTRSPSKSSTRWATLTASILLRERTNAFRECPEPLPPSGAPRDLIPWQPWT